MKYLAVEDYFLAAEKRFSLLSRAVFALLLVGYGLKSAEISLAGIDPIVAVWAVLAVVALQNVKKLSGVPVIFTYALLAAFYALGGMRGLSSFEAGDYYRNIATASLLTLILSGLLINNSTKTGKLLGKLLSSVGLTIFLLILYWIIFISRSQGVVDYAVRESGAANYLTLSDLIALLSLTYVGRLNERFVNRISWTIIGLSAIMLLGSRASLLIFAPIALILLSIGNRKSVTLLIMRGIALSIIMGATIYAFLIAFDDTVTYRISTLSSLDVDESASSRGALAGEYLSVLQYDLSCLLIPCHPSSGNYVHNAMSIVQYFGIAGIGLLFGGVAVLIVAGMRGWRPWLPALLFYSSLQLAFFRSWTSLVFPVAVAYLYSALFFLTAARRQRSSLTEQNRAKKKLEVR